MSLIIISSLAVILLTAFQVKWIDEARSLREAQFDHRVSLAMCYAINKLEDKPLDCMTQGASCVKTDGDAIRACGMEVPQNVDRRRLDTLLRAAFALHDIQAGGFDGILATFATRTKPTPTK